MLNFDPITSHDPLPCLTVTRLGWPISNAWLITSEISGPVLVDTGFSLMWPAIARKLRRHDLTPADLSAVILTHRHKDHTGNAQRFVRAGVPTYAHLHDAAILMGREQAKPLAGPRGPVSWMSHLENKRPTRLSNVEVLGDGDTIAGLEVIPCPGHTRGSIMLYHRPSESLFSGDALLNAVPPYVYKTALSLPHPNFCDDYGQALESLRALLKRDLPIKTLYAGHGPPRSGILRDELGALLDRAL